MFLTGIQLYEFCPVAKHDKQTRDLARELFLKANLSGKEIAERLGVNEKTIGRWRSDENWDSLMTTYTMTKANQMELLVQQLRTINENILLRAITDRYATSKEADIIIKLTQAIKNLETELSASDVVDVCIRFTSWIKDHDPEKSKEITLLFDKFIKSFA